MAGALVRITREPLIVGRMNIVPGCPEQRRDLDRQVLVDLDFNFQSKSERSAR